MFSSKNLELESEASLLCSSLRFSSLLSSCLGPPTITLSPISCNKGPPSHCIIHRKRSSSCARPTNGVLGFRGLGFRVYLMGLGGGAEEKASLPSPVHFFCFFFFFFFFFFCCCRRSKIFLCILKGQQGLLFRVLAILLVCVSLFFNSIGFWVVQ